MSDRTPTKRRRTVDAQRIGLFDAMLQGSSLKQLILDWTSDYQKDKVEAMAQLINLCVQASGCPSTVDTSQVEDSDNYSDTLEELQTYFEPQSQHQYPIASKKGDYAKFRKIFVDFWTKFVDSMRSNALYDDDNYCFETLVSWLGTMSSSTFRPFRHTGTLAALALQTQLSKTCQMTHDEALGYTKQLSGAKGTRKANLEERLEEAQAKTIRTRDLVKSLFDIIFVHRYRDIDPVIRADCIKELGKCVLYCSHLFLDTQHVRYLGWMLSDKSSQVRMEALKSISKLFEQDEFFDSLGPIAERFKPRIIDMATMEKENNIRHEAIKALCLMSDAGFLDEEDEEKMMPILAHNDQKARDLVAPAIVSMYKTLAARMEDEESYESFGSLKAYCQVMTKLSQLVEEKEEEEEKESQTMVLSDASFTPVLLEMQSQAKIDCTDLLDWIASQDFHDASPIGYNLVSLAAASLSNHIDLDPQQIGDYLTRDVDEPIFQLNQQEECILLYTMSYCTTKEMDDDKKAEASAVLIKVLPLLLSKYAVDLEHLPKLIETLEMAKKLDVQAFVDLQEMEALDALCQQIITLLNKSFNKRVVELGLETLYGLTDTASGTVQDAVPTFVENVVLEWKQAMKHAQQTFEEQGVLDTEPFERLGKWMQLMQYLVNHERFYEHCKIMTFEQIDGIYDISKICLDYGLDLLQRNLSEDGRSNLINTSTDIVQASLHIMMINLLYRLKDMVDLASLVEHSQTLVNFCQGIVSASGQSDLQLPIPIKIVALRMLSGLFPLLNGNVVEQYPQLQHHIAEPAQESCINLLSYVIELLAVHAPLLKTKASFSTVHYNLLETVNIFWNLSLNGQMTIGAASGLAQWFSVEDVSIVGPTHNCIISNGIQKCFSKVMEQPDQHLHMIQHLPFFVQKTIENSMRLYFTGSISLQSQEELFKLIGEQIKALHQHIVSQNRETANALGRMVSDAIAKGLIEAAEYIANCLASHDPLMEQLQMDMSFQQNMADLCTWFGTRNTILEDMDQMLMAFENLSWVASPLGQLMTQAPDEDTLKASDITSAFETAFDKHGLEQKKWHSYEEFVESLGKTKTVKKKKIPKRRKTVQLDLEVVSRDSIGSTRSSKRLSGRVLKSMAESSDDEPDTPKRYVDTEFESPEVKRTRIF